MKTAIVTGGSSGLGACIIEALDDSWTIYDWSIENGVDISSSNSILSARTSLFRRRIEKIDFLINCAGINEIGYTRQFPEDTWDRILDINAKGIFLTAKYLCEMLRGGTIVNIVSNASHIPMTASIAYNASKGAAAIMTKQMARELGKTHDITVFAISPNKLAGTGMSRQIDEDVQDVRGWTAEEARAYQLAALPAGEETPPKLVAEFLAFLLSSKDRHKYLQGCDIPYGGP